jgi:ribonuclease HI
MSLDMMDYDAMDDEKARQWAPHMETYYSHIARTKPAKLLKYNKEKQFNQLQGSNMARRNEPRLSKPTLVVHIDGACRNSGKENARAAFGVYFGPNSKYNLSGLLDPSLPQTSDRAEIEALTQALRAIKQIADNDYSVSEVKIANDSRYLTDGICFRVNAQKNDETISSEEYPVANYDLLEDIRGTLDAMQYGDDGGIECQMWLVTSHMNVDADRLANRAFKRSS